MKYPPDAAMSLAKVNTLRLCFLEYYLILLATIRLCTGYPPAELIETARAEALLALILLSLCETNYALSYY